MARPLYISITSPGNLTLTRASLALSQYRAILGRRAKSAHRRLDHDRTTRSRSTRVTLPLTWLVLLSTLHSSGLPSSPSTCSVRSATPRRSSGPRASSWPSSSSSSSSASYSTAVAARTSSPSTSEGGTGRTRVLSQTGSRASAPSSYVSSAPPSPPRSDRLTHIAFHPIRSRPLSRSPVLSLSVSLRPRPRTRARRSPRPSRTPSGVSCVCL